MTECGGIHSSRPEDVLPGINLDNSVYKKNSCQVFFFLFPQDLFSEVPSHFMFWRKPFIQ